MVTVGCGASWSLPWKRATSSLSASWADARSTRLASMTSCGGCSVAKLTKLAWKSFANARHEKHSHAIGTSHSHAEENHAGCIYAFGPISIFARRRIRPAAVFSGSAPHALHSQ